MEALILYNQSYKYLIGQGVAKDEQHSFTLNSKAAYLGHADAILAMGWYYLNGIGVERDLERARKWYRDSARRGDTWAMFSLGQIAYEERDYVEAHIWFKRAYEAKHVRSLYYLGRLYWRGQGVDMDKPEAMRCFHRAAGLNVKEAKRVLKFLTRKIDPEKNL